MALKANIFFLSLVLFLSRIDHTGAIKCYVCRGSSPDECTKDNAKENDCPGQCVRFVGAFSDDPDETVYVRTCYSYKKDKIDACKALKGSAAKVEKCESCEEDECNSAEFK